jgi:hypothetical protein
MTPSNVETEPRSAGQIAEWFTGRQLVIVAETEATGPVAFAASFPYRDRACYSGIGEFSVYVRRDYRGPRRRPRGTRRTSGGGYPLDAVHSLVPFFSPRCRVRRPCETRFGFPLPQHVDTRDALPAARAGGFAGRLRHRRIQLSGWMLNWEQYRPPWPFSHVESPSFTKLSARLTAARKALTVSGSFWPGALQLMINAK